VFQGSASLPPVAVWEALADAERERARRRRGLVWFWLLTVAGVGLGGLVGWSVGSPLLGLAVGGGVGAVVGTVASALVWAWPVLRPVWNWRVELATAAIVVAGAVGVASLSGSWWWSLALLVPLGVAVVVPAARRRLVAFVWCQITRHRLQTCFAAFIKATNRVTPGLVPLVLSVRSTPAGERAWLWLRPGLDLADLQQNTDKIAVACWARSAQVVASPRCAALVRVDITRRDPLARLVTSPLSVTIPAQRPAPTASVGSLDGLGLDLADVPEPVEGVRR
jgi:hypothetical protein